ncbi:BPTI/Kunitz domain-containing protein [Trichinella spiralis]|uniref:BPTI/Kunitz domain-containing protein n=1 Tax=Trichinella spiralis TaxID=6334 RepID=A0ABR3KIW1_TRISP
MNKLIVNFFYTACFLFLCFCHLSTAEDDDDVCTWPLDRGSCEKYSIRWFYNETTEMCVKFLYGGCQGNVNNFISRIECERRCRKFSSYSQTGDNCLLDVNPGLCKNVQLRWYFNKKKGTCESFIYGGCGGNGNNFHTEEECQNQCLNTNLCHGKVDGYYIYDESNPCTRHFYRCSNARYDAFYCLENWRFDIVNGAFLRHVLELTCSTFNRIKITLSEETDERKKSTVTDGLIKWTGRCGNFFNEHASQWKSIGSA